MNGIWSMYEWNSKCMYNSGWKLYRKEAVEIEKNLKDNIKMYKFKGKFVPVLN
jgi:hypothetical protein